MRIDSSCSASKWPRNMVADDFHFRETDARMHICSNGSVPSGNLVHDCICDKLTRKYISLED